MTPTPKTQTKAIRPLVTLEQMKRTLSKQRSLTSEEFYLQAEAHLGRSMPPARKLSCVNGRWVMVDC
jgi:hypothetical protein